MYTFFILIKFFDIHIIIILYNIYIYISYIKWNKNYKLLIISVI